MKEHWFWDRVLQHKPIFWRIMVAATMINLLSVGSSIFIMVVYDRVIPNAAFSSLYALCAGMLILIIFDFILKNTRAWFIDFAGTQIDTTVGKDVYERVVQTKGIQNMSSLGGLSNTIKDFDIVKDFFTSASVALIVDLPFILFFIFVIYLIAGSLAIIPLAIVPIILVIGMLVQRPLNNLSESMNLNAKSKHSIIVESLSGIETLQAIGANKFFSQRYQEAIESSAGSSRKAKILGQVTSFAAGSAQQISLVLIIFYGTFLIFDGETSMGAMIAAVLLSSRALAPLAQIAGLFGRMHSAKSAYLKLDNLVQMCEKTLKSNTSQISKLSGIEVSNLSFGYSEDRSCINNIGFKVSPGEKIGFLGKNGSGKSTLLKLLAGLIQPSSGNILFSGLPLGEIDSKILHAKLGILLQDVHLFSGTLKDNILLGREFINEEQLANALEFSGVKDFLDFLPGGLDFQLADRGMSLSGGQKQAIALARAIANDPEILILDEPTASMDLNAEASLTAKLQTFTKDKIVLVATHRLPIINGLDRVIVINNGAIKLDEPRESALKKIIQKPKE